MIRIRKFTPADVPQLTALLSTRGKREISNLKDSIFIAEISDRIVGVMAMRAIPLVHTFEIAETSAMRRVAQALGDYARGFTAASKYDEALFHVEPSNEPMQRFCEEQGAVLCPDAKIYTLEVR